MHVKSPSGKKTDEEDPELSQRVTVQRIMVEMLERWKLLQNKKSVQVSLYNRIFFRELFLSDISDSRLTHQSCCNSKTERRPTAIKVK